MHGNKVSRFSVRWRTKNKYAADYGGEETVINSYKQVLPRNVMQCSATDPTSTTGIFPCSFQITLDKSRKRYGWQLNSGSSVTVADSST